MYQIGAKEIFIADIPVERLLKELPAAKNWQKIKFLLVLQKMNLSVILQNSI